jgi:putative endopeptidase
MVRVLFRFGFSLMGVLLLTLNLGFSNSKKASSEIPARREFPTNPLISPCENFFEHACSEAVSRFELREDRSKHIFSFSDSHERILEAKKKFLSALPGKKGANQRLSTLSNVYSACMNAQASSSEEKENVERIKAQVLGFSDRDAFLTFVGKQIETGEYSFFDWGVTGNLADSDWDDVYILADVQTLPERTYYEKPEVLADLQALVTKAFLSAGVDNPEQRAKWVVDFEKEFAKTFPPPAELREIFNVKTEISRENLLKRYPTFRLAAFLDRIPKRTHFRDLTPKNFVFMQERLQKAPLDVLKSVYLFHSLTGYMDDAYPDYFEMAFDFNKKHLGGPNVRPVRQERCTVYLMNKFTKELDAELLNEIFPSFSEQKLVGLVERVRQSIIAGIQSNQWLSPKSKKAAIHKIQVAKLQLVKPKNDKEWDFNPPADYSPEKRYDNGRLYERKQTDKQLAELAEPRHRNRWEMGPLTINAYYSPSDNKFVMPIGILQYPFYDPALPDSTNLGAVGMVVGHELGHGIDDHGARYDSTGRMIQWMDPRDVKEFEKRGSKLVDQFNKAGHNGKLTLGENIGDLVGLTFAFNAAFPEGKGTPEEKKAFFLQYARAWCGVIRPKFREVLLKTDPHSLIEARVNEQVKHQAAFQEVFGCKADDKMVLPNSERVKIW